HRRPLVVVRAVAGIAVGPVAVRRRGAAIRRGARVRRDRGGTWMRCSPRESGKPPHGGEHARDARISTIAPSDQLRQRDDDPACGLGGHMLDQSGEVTNVRRAALSLKKFWFHPSNRKKVGPNLADKPIFLRLNERRATGRSTGASYSAGPAGR